MEFRVLGPLQVLDGNRQVDVGGARAASLLAALLAQRGEAISQDRLAEAIWPDSSRSRDNLQSYVSRIRRELGSEGKEILVRSGTGYALDPTVEVDAARFEALLTEASELIRDDPSSALESTEAALDLWHGAAFGEFADDELVKPEASRLEELRLEAREQWVDAQLALGNHRQVIGEIERLCDAHPLRERLWELRMLALVRSGRQAEALRCYQEAREILVEELGIEPSEQLRQIEQMVLNQDPALELPQSPVTAPLGQGPALAAPSGVAPEPQLPGELNTFIGREDEIAEVTRLLTEARLVTLTGIGGVGKTRLAIQVARNAAAGYPAGVAMADLSDVTDPSEIRARVGETLATSEGHGAFLLVVDNCEHLIDDSADAVSANLVAYPHARILATSREPLRIPGEVRWRVEPMSVPGADANAKQLADNTAARLFVDRSRANRPGLEFNEETMLDVADICRRLDGIPLAIELAAALVGGMGIGQIKHGLADRFTLLTEGYRGAPARQQTLASTFDWSYELLDVAEKLLLQQLRPLPGGFSTRAAEVMCAASPSEEAATGRVLSRLVDRSLVTMEESGGQATFSILPTISDFIFAQGSREATQFENRGFVVYLAQHTEPRLRGTTAEMWAALFDGPTDVARATLDKAYEVHDLEAGSFLAGVVAARTTRSGRIGFVGGVRSSYIRRFEVGYVAGARHVDTDVSVKVDYLSVSPDFSGFMDEGKALRRTSELLDSGVDVVFHAAGVWGGQGVFEAVRNWHESNDGTAWVIGVDLDERVSRAPELQPHVLTSMRRQIPRTVYLDIKAAVAGGAPERAPALDLANEGVGMSMTGGQIDHLTTELADVRHRVIAGEIDIPTVDHSGSWWES